jgi:23S rRNA (guanine745-N1)-methyltransferase
MSKKLQAKQLLTDVSDVFRCPVCLETLRPNEQFSLVCQNRHTYDLSKTGSLHLMLNYKTQQKYTADLFEARQALSRAGFFAPLLEPAEAIGLSHLHKRTEAPIRVLDAGCGEGSHLAQLVRAWSAGGARRMFGVGIDLSKEAIRLASRSYPGLIWSVADVSNCPLIDHQFQIVLNIFSPTNYAEMQRLLAPDGILIKIVPGADYLRELRTLLYSRDDRRSYSNDRVVAHFRNHFRRTEVIPVRYRRSLQPGELELLLRMSPLAWGAREQAKRDAALSGLQTVTIDAVILLGSSE